MKQQRELWIQLRDPTQLTPPPLPPYTESDHRCGCTGPCSKALIRPVGRSAEQLVLLLSPENGASKVLPPNLYLLWLLSKGQIEMGTQWELLQEVVLLGFRHTPSPPAGATGQATARAVPN